MVFVGYPVGGSLDRDTIGNHQAVNGGARRLTPRVAAVLSVLGDSTRRRLIDQLAHDGPLNASQLARSYPVSRQAVVKHLAVLEDAGVVTGHRTGNEVRFELEGKALSDTASWLVDVGNEWDRRLDALQRHMKAPKRPVRRPGSR
jgi:DNA-binding transcriptional ArsR family regulator